MGDAHTFGLVGNRNDKSTVQFLVGRSRDLHVTFLVHESLRTGLRSVGLNAHDISCHSFRRGGTTLAFQAGMNVLDIKLRGE